MKKALTIALIALCCNFNKSYSQFMHALDSLRAEPVSNFIDSVPAMALTRLHSIYDSNIQTSDAYRSFDEDYLFIPYCLKHLVDSMNEKKIATGIYDKSRRMSSQRDK